MPVVTAQAPLPTTSTIAPLAPEAPISTEAIETVPEVKKEEAISPKFAELARREKGLRQLQKQIQEEKAALKAKEDEYKTNYIPKSQLTANPYQTLLDAGFTHDQLLQLSLNVPNPQDQAYQKLQAEIQALKAETELTKKAHQDTQTKAYENAVNQVRRDAVKIVESNPEFETIKELGATEAVVELIKQTFDTDGTLLSVEDAAKQVEEHLLEEALKMASLNKIKAKMQPPAPAAPEKKTFQEAIKQTPPAMKTLTNAALSVPSSALSTKQRRERAIAAFNGQQIT